MVLFLNNRGYHYTNVKEDEFDMYMKYSKKMEKLWTEDDCVDYYNGCYIIKISHDELMSEIYNQYE